MTYRETCGTARGALAHQRASEKLCGWCTHAEAVARLSAEAVPQRKPAAVPLLGSESMAIQERRASLLRALD